MYGFSLVFIVTFFPTMPDPCFSSMMFFFEEFNYEPEIQQSSACQRNVSSNCKCKRGEELIEHARSAAKERCQLWTPRKGSQSVYHIQSEFNTDQIQCLAGVFTEKKDFGQIFNKLQKKMCNKKKTTPKAHIYIYIDHLFIKFDIAFSMIPCCSIFSPFSENLSCIVVFFLKRIFSL